MRRFPLRALPLAAVWWLSLPGAAEASESRADAVRCLALALYWEAKSEGPEGMRAVASVVLNRVAHPEFPDSVCAVVKDGGEEPPCQFAWWCDGKSDMPTEHRAWMLAERLARAMLERAGARCDPGRLVLPQHLDRTPWVRRRERTVQIGRHIFYR